MTSDKDTEERNVARDEQADGSGEDTEGHSMLIDPNTAMRLARARSSDLQREARDNQRAKEARPNRDKR